MTCSDFDGCKYGIVSIKRGCEGKPIRKPWRISSNEPSFLRTFSILCDGLHQMFHVMALTRPTRGIIRPSWPSVCVMHGIQWRKGNDVEPLWLEPSQLAQF